LIDVKRIYFIAAIASYIYILLHFNSSIDAFAPLQISAVDETIERGFLLDAYRNTVPTFHILGSQLALMLGKDCSFLLFSPIQLIPYAALFFLLMLKLSDSYFLAGLVSLTELTTGYAGTQRIFFWPHGIGSILYFALLILFLLMFSEKNRSVWQYHLMAVIIGISLVFTSYDVIFTFLLFLSSFVIYLIIINKPRHPFRANLDCRSQQSIKLLILLIIVELGLTEFVYNNFIHALKSSDSFTTSVLDKFLLSYFAASIQDNILKDIYLHYPQGITLYGYIKYGILLAFLILFLIYFISLPEMRHRIKPIFILSILSSMVIWAFIRLMIGHVEIGFFYYPAIFSIAWIFRNGGSFRRWAAVGVIVLLALNPVYHFMIYNGELSNKDVDKFNYLNLPLSWIKEESSGELIRGDELTKNFYLMSFRTQDFQTLDENDVAFLLNRSEYNVNNYFIINENLNVIDIVNWVQIEPWRHFGGALDCNKRISKILDSEKILIYMRTR
jgi:hypothetical protein